MHIQFTNSDRASSFFTLSLWKTIYQGLQETNLSFLQNKTSILPLHTHFVSTKEQHTQACNVYIILMVTFLFVWFAIGHGCCIWWSTTWTHKGNYCWRFSQACLWSLACLGFVESKLLTEHQWPPLVVILFITYGSPSATPIYFSSASTLSILISDSDISLISSYNKWELI